MDSGEKTSVKVLFVCLGNICRSPSAEAVFRAKVDKEQLQEKILIDSCGTAAYHVGEQPDARAVMAAENRGYAMSHLLARQLKPSDFLEFDYLLAMDEDNLANIKSRMPANTNPDIRLFMDFHPQENFRDVPDPYYGGEKGFEKVLDMIELASEGLLSHIKLHDFK